MTVTFLVASLVVFVTVLRLLDAVGVARSAVDMAQDALGVITDPDLSDDVKEPTVRRASLRLFGCFLLIGGIAVAAFVAAALVMWVGAVAGLYTTDEAVRVATGWPFILVSSAGAIAAWIALDRRVVSANGKEADRSEVPYGSLDKALHNMAFASPQMQRRLAEVETRLCRRRIDPARAARPVFVTSLPRAGTTILLQMLARCPELASATYRHMPFTLAPLLWGRFSSVFRRTSAFSERAHGDGIEVGLDSPEAFEEMLWMAFWPDHYRCDHILPWRSDERNAEFETLFRTHLAKVVATKPWACRYLSKNNASIARLSLLEAMHPDATVLIPVRDPAAQVASLLRQHRRFADLHAREPFARQYMEGLGHFEFGGALRPIAFGVVPDPVRADDVEFWLGYWVRAYEHVLASAGERAVFFDHDALCTDPAPRLAALADVLGLAEPAALTRQADMLRSPPPAPSLEEATPALMRRAREVHDELCRRALGPAPGVRSA